MVILLSSVKELNHLLLPFLRFNGYRVIELSHFDMHIRNQCKEQLVIQYLQLLDEVKQLYTSITSTYLHVEARTHYMRSHSINALDIHP